MINIIYAFAALGIYRHVVAVYRVLRLRTADGISVSSQTLLLAEHSMWAVYTSAHGVIPLAILNILSVPADLIILAVARAYDHSIPTRSIPPLAACVVVPATLAIALPQLLVPIVIAAAIASTLPQFYKSWVNPAGLGVSVAAFSINAILQVCWSLYGFAIGDTVIGVTSIYFMTWTSYVAARSYFARRLSSYA